MRYRQLGSFGPTVSVLGLGASHFGRVCDLEQTRAIVHAALDAGITFIDTAEAYAGSEDLLGQVLQEPPVDPSAGQARLARSRAGVDRGHATAPADGLSGPLPDALR